MKILDKQRYWSFIKAYVICYVSLVGLYVVIDAFSNMDEFSKRADSVTEMFQIMSRYYLVHQSQFFDQLCGVIGMMAAIFTVTWMQRNNEQLAMLAAGVSTHRAIVPVLVSSIIVSVLSVYNQEVIIPGFGEELARRHDDDGQQRVNSVSIRYDSRENMIHAKQADRATRTIMPFFCTIDKGNFGADLRAGRPAGDVHPARPSHRAPQGGLAGARGHRSILHSMTRSSRRATRSSPGSTTPGASRRRWSSPASPTHPTRRNRPLPNTSPLRSSRRIRRSPTWRRSLPCPSA